MDAKDSEGEGQGLFHGLMPGSVLTLGLMAPDVVACFGDSAGANLTVVLTAKQREHYLLRHPEVIGLERLLRQAVLEPDEVHRNKVDTGMAILYRRLDDTHYLRVAVLMQPAAGERKHSVLSFRLANRNEVARGRARCVWARQ